MILPPVDLEQMKELEEGLSQVQDLRLVLVSGSIEEGTRMVVSAGKPISLISALREISLVDQVIKKDKEIQISLKAK